MCAKECVYVHACTCTCVCVCILYVGKLIQPSVGSQGNFPSQPLQGRLRSPNRKPVCLSIPTGSHHSSCLSFVIEINKYTAFSGYLVLCLLQSKEFFRVLGLLHLGFCGLAQFKEIVLYLPHNTHRFPLPSQLFVDSQS